MANELTTLLTLAVEIDALNEQANIFANQAVIYAAKSGQKLLLAKAQCNHGQFKSWLDENCKLPYSTANKYMKLATARPELLTSNVPLTVLLPSITQMMELMTADESVNEVVTAKIESGEDVTIKEIQRLKKEAADLLAEKESTQKDLMFTKSMLEAESTKYQAASRQRDELRDNQQQIIDAKLSEERAKLVLENHQAIAEAKREHDNTKSEIERLKREQAKAISDGIGKKMLELDNEIRSKEQSVLTLENRTNELLETKRSLDKEVGLIQVHKQAFEAASKELHAFTTSFAEAHDTREIPAECFNDWQSLYYGISKLKKQMGQWFDDKAPRDAEALIGELVN